MKEINKDVIKKSKDFMELVRERMGDEAFKSFKERAEFVKKQKELVQAITKAKEFIAFKMENPYKKLKEGEDQLKDNIAKVVIELSKYGWYANYSFSLIDLTEAYQLLKKKGIGELDEYMSAKIIEQYANIKKTLLERHVDRRKPLEAAFRAHEMKEFFLSIPVWFAQTDGVSKDLTQLQFFLNNNKDHSPKVASWAKETPKIWMHIALCAALLDKGAFQKHYSQPNEIDITRHAVLHGESNDYGSELNSLKAISLIMYISDVMTPRVLSQP